MGTPGSRFHPYRTAHRHCRTRHSRRDRGVLPLGSHRSEQGCACTSDGKTVEIAVDAYQAEPGASRLTRRTAGHRRRWSVPAPVAGQQQRLHHHDRRPQAGPRERQHAYDSSGGGTNPCATLTRRAAQRNIKCEPKRPARWAGRFGIHCRNERGDGNSEHHERTTRPVAAGAVGPPGFRPAARERLRATGSGSTASSSPCRDAPAITGEEIDELVHGMLSPDQEAMLEEHQDVDFS